MMTYSLRATRYLVWKSVDWMRTATFLFQLCSLRSPCQCLVSKYLPKRTLNAGLTCLLLLCHRFRLVLTCLSATTFLRLQNLGRWSTQLMMVLMQFVRFWAGPSMALWGVPLALMIGIKLCLAEFKWPLDWKISYRNSSVLTSVSSLYFLARRQFQLRTKSSWIWSTVKPFCEMVLGSPTPERTQKEVPVQQCFSEEIHRLHWWPLCQGPCEPSSRWRPFSWGWKGVVFAPPWSYSRPQEQVEGCVWRFGQVCWQLPQWSLVIGAGS